MATAYAVEKPPEIVLVTDSAHVGSAIYDIPEYEEEQGDELLLNGQLVEIHGLDVKEEVFSAPGATPTGKDYEEKAVDGSILNGKAGRARYIGEGVYGVDLFDGKSFYIPGKNLREHEALTAEEGGFDVAWPDVETGDVMWFGVNTVEALQRKGYCIIQTFQPPEVSSAMAARAADRTDWTQPRPDFETAFLGQGSKSTVSWFHEDTSPGDDAHAYLQTVKDLGSVLASFSGDGLGFNLLPSLPQQSMLRRRSEQRDKQNRYEEGTPEQEEDRTERFVQFFQHRRLCVMNVVTCEHGGTIEFIPWHKDSGLERSTISIAAGLMIVFRHDLLGYSYVPEGPDLIFQAWLMQIPPSLELSRIEASQEDMMEVLNMTSHGPSMIDNREVKIMSVAGYMAGKTFTFQETKHLYMSGTDGLVQIPQTRWNHDLYYDEDIRKGLAVCKHSGFMDSEYAFTFDPAAFGYTMDDAKAFTWWMMKQVEAAHECLHQVGKTPANMKGERFYWTIGDAQRDIAKDEKFERSDGKWTWHSLMPSFIQYHFGTVGVAQSVDTACSASMVAYAALMQELKPSRDSKKHHRLTGDMEYDQGSVGGNTALVHPLPYIGMSQARMLGAMGRSVTFDMSANGFIRGEAFVHLYFKLSTDEKDALEQLCTAVGASSNQDGRSASLTAPNGPSQTACVRISCRDIDRHPHEVSITELHGTGTALGDPIETGSTRALMVGFKPGTTREKPLLHTAGKSQSGHTELAAGSMGLVRTTIVIYGATCVPNCHIRELNSNIEYVGYPAIFPTEGVDFGVESLSAGVNSFGFGGTNARADLWGTCKSGPRRTAQLALRPTGRAVARLDVRPDLATNTSTSGEWPVPHEVRKTGHSNQNVDIERVGSVLIQCPKCSGQMCWLCKEAHTDGKHHRCTQVRAEGGDYSVCSNCYEGGYLAGAPPEDIIELDQGLFITGTWSMFQPIEMKQRVDADGNLVLVHRFTLGKDRKPRFAFAVDKEMTSFLYPPVPNAGQHAEIRGPGPFDQMSKGGTYTFGTYWTIDADEESAPVGSTYEIEFFVRLKKRVSWKCVDRPMLGNGDQSKDVAEKLQVSEKVQAWTGGDWTTDEQRLVEQRAKDQEESGDYSGVEYFSICTSDSGWFPQLMTWSELGDANGDDTDLWEARVKIGFTRRTEFYFMRSDDPLQCIFPVEAVTASNSVRASFVDEPKQAQILSNQANVNKRCWVIEGSPGSTAVVQIRMRGAHIMVRVHGDERGDRVWEQH